MLLVLIIIMAVWLFYHLQRYIVYDKDGLRLDLSAQREEILHPGQSEVVDAPSTFVPVDVEIVVKEKDYSELVTSAGSNLQPIKAVSVPAAEVSESVLKYYSSNMGDFDTLILELKAEDGFLRWHSSVAMADSFAVNGTLELAESVTTLKENGVYLVARLSVLSDALMAQRNVPIALKNAASGGAFTDGKGNYYLDPYSSGTRDYLRSLISELQAIGFDEILLDGFVCPDSEYLQFSQSMTQTPTPATALSSLALWLREQADAIGIKLSVVMEPDALRSETVLLGQNPVLLFRVFDRVAVETDFDHMETDLSAMEAALGSDDENRSILITDNFAPERKSYIVK